MTKFQNKYRVESHRKPNWDYSSGAYYFITICCQHQKHYFGKIENHKMILSDFGKIVEKEWHESFKLRKELFLDEFILMPNHLHAIILIDPLQTHGRAFLSDDEKILRDTETHGCASLHHDDPVQTHGRASLPFTRKPKSISSFISGFKSATTNKIDDFIDDLNLPIKKFNRNNKFWQSNYYDHIIQNENAYINIKNYIINNPAKWEEDKFH
ncbi:MAG: hypothetical protein Q8O62_05540 [Aequorivita sp.]|nr:hypothetical protein [Aequorivita sp.]